MDTKTQYKKVIASLNLLSLPFDEQKKYFPEFAEVPFEVIDTFDHAVLHLPLLIELGNFENNAIANILRLQNLIHFTASNPNLKDLDDEQFRIADEWNKVREMAKVVLQSMGEPLGKPDANYI